MTYQSGYEVATLDSTDNTATDLVLYNRISAIYNAFAGA